MYANHVFFPLSLSTQVTTPALWNQLREKVTKLGLLEDAAKENLHQISICSELILQKHSELTRKLDETKRILLEKLTRTKQFLVSQVAKSIKDLQNNLLTQKMQFESAISQIFFEFMQSEEEFPRFNLFSYRRNCENSENLEELFDIFWETPMDFANFSKKVEAKPSLTCQFLCTSFKTRLSTEITELVSKSTLEEIKNSSESDYSEVESYLKLAMNSIKEGKMSDFLSEIGVKIEGKAGNRVSGRVRGKVALLAVMEMMFAEENLEMHRSVGYKNRVLEGLEAGMDAVFLQTQVKRAESSRSWESKEQQLMEDLKVLENSSLRTPIAPVETKGASQLAQALEMRKTHVTEDSIRNLEKTVMSMNETMHLFFKVSVALGQGKMTYETVDRVVSELVPRPHPTQYLPIGTGDCLTTMLRRHPSRTGNPFLTHPSPYDSPEELISFLLSEHHSPVNTGFILPIVRPGSVVTFDCRSHAYTTQVFTPSIRVDSKSSYITLPIGDLLVCGGTWQKAAIPDCYELNLSTQSSTRLPDMTQPRCFHGLIFYYNSVYTFGGLSGKPLKSCEKLTLSPPVWTEICDLLAPRSAFNPCEFHDFIYIMGGNQPDCEVFDPLMESFSLLSLSLPDISNSCLFHSDDSFFLLTNHKFVTWNGFSESVSTHKKLCAWTNSPPVVYGNNVYLSLLDCSCLPDKKCVQQVSVKTGVIVGYPLDESVVS